MKAKIRKTGGIVNITDSYGNSIELKPEEVELIQEPIEDEHWKDIRERAAIAAMQGAMNFFCSIDYNRDAIAKLAIEQADTLIEELKKK